MIYPTFNPVNPLLDDLYGLPVLSGYPYRDVLFVEGTASSEEDALHKNPWISVNSKDLMPLLFNDSLLEYSPDRVAEYFVSLQSMLKYLYWIPNSIEAADPQTIPGGGGSSVNFAFSIPFQCSVNGNQVTIQNSNGKPRNLSINTTFESALDSGTGKPVWNSTSMGISPGMEIRIDSPYRTSKRGLISKIISSDSNSTTVETTRNFGASRTTTCYLCDRVLTDGFEQVNVRRDLWTARRTETVTKEQLEILDNKFILTDPTGQPCRIAEPYRSGQHAYEYVSGTMDIKRYGTFRILAKTGSDPWHDVTINYNDISRADSKIYNEIIDGKWYTTIDFSTGTADQYQIDYCYELPLSSASILTTESARIRTLRGCANCFKDWTESVANISGCDHVTTDIYGHHYYCNVAGQSGVNLSMFKDAKGDCCNYRCSRYVPMNLYPWKLSISSLKKLCLAKYEYTMQILAGNPSVCYLMGYGGIPSISWLAGMPHYTQNTFYGETEGPVGSPYCWLEDDTRPERVGLKRGWAGIELLKRNNDYPDQSCPNGSPSANDGTDFSEINNWIPGVRNTGFTPVDYGSRLYGFSNIHCQTSYQRQLTIRGIDMSVAKQNQEQILNGCSVTHVYNEFPPLDYLDVWIGRNHYLPNKNIQPQAKLINRWSINGDILSLQMNLGYDYCGYFDSSENNGFQMFATAGMTVEPKQDLKPWNSASLSIHSCLGPCDAKVAKGDTVTIPSLPNNLGNIKMQVLSVQAHGGQEPLTSTIEPGTADTIEYTVGGVFLPSNTQTFEPVSIRYDYDINTELYSFKNMSRGNMDFDSPDVEAAYWLASGNSSNSAGPIIPGDYHVRRAVVQYALTMMMPDTNKLLYTVKYKEIGSNVIQTGRGNFGCPIMQYTGIPNIPIKGYPNLSTPPTFQVWIDNTEGWRTINLTSPNTILSGKYDFLQLPEHGHFNYVCVGSNYYIIPPVDLYGYRVKVSIVYQFVSNIDIDADPVSPFGYTPNYFGCRKNMDVIRLNCSCPLTSRVLQYFNDNSASISPNQYAIEASQQGIFPPTIYFDSDGTLQECEQPISVKHLTRINEVHDSSEDLVIDDIQLDRANGHMSIGSIDWDTTTQNLYHDLNITGRFLDSGSGVSTDLLFGLRRDLEQFTTYQLSNLCAGQGYFQLACYNPKLDIYGFNKFSFSPSPLANHTIDDFKFEPVEPGNPEDYKWVLHATYADYGGVSSDIPSGDPVRYFFEGRVNSVFQVVAINPDNLPAVNSDHIEAIYVDVKMWDGEVTDTRVTFGPAGIFDYNTQSHTTTTTTALNESGLYLGLWKCKLNSKGDMEVAEMCGSLAVSNFHSYTLNDSTVYQTTIDATGLFIYVMDHPLGENDFYMLVNGASDTGADGLSMFKKYVLNYSFSVDGDGKCSWDITTRETKWSQFDVSGGWVVLKPEKILETCPTISMRLPPYDV